MIARTAMEARTTGLLAGLVVVLAGVAKALFTAAEPNRRARLTAVFFILVVFTTSGAIIGMVALLILNGG
jgi:F0F1-type ATP synthase membrane subunit c/vacuolar-type H+-ATPase subunit K